jgi:DNA-binding NtrC family response regulator
MMILVPLWMVADQGSSLLGAVVALVTGCGSAVMIVAGNDRGPALWTAVIPVSMGLAVPAPFIAESPAMRRLVALLDQVMRSDVTVLIEGETGSGKELVARTIHAGGPRRAGPFVAVNCAAIPDSLAESELFGHERGAFTGALQAQPGWFEQAQGGIIFLDEIGETPLSVQAKLLRALQEREVRRVGSRHAIRVDVRILAATNEGLQGLVQARRVRQDLYHRLHVVTLAVPPLRERLADLAPLAQHFLALHAGRAQKPLAFSAEAMTRMREHPWPGNVRELEHAVQRAVVLARGPEIMPDDLGLDGSSGWSRPAWPGPSGARSAGVSGAPMSAAGGEGALSPLQREPAPSTEPKTLSELERERILAVLERCQGNRRAAAQVLGLIPPPCGVNCGGTRRRTRAPSAHREAKAMSSHARQPRSRGDLLVSVAGGTVMRQRGTPP